MHKFGCAILSEDAIRPLYGLKRLDIQEIILNNGKTTYLQAVDVKYTSHYKTGQTDILAKILLQGKSDYSK